MCVPATCVTDRPDLFVAELRKVQRHKERLRTEAPRIYAALEPLLEDLEVWMKAVGCQVSDNYYGRRGRR